MSRTTRCILLVLVSIVLALPAIAQKRKSATTPSKEYRVRFFWESTEELPTFEGAMGAFQMEDETNRLSKQGYEVISVAGVTGKSDAVNKTARLTHFVVIYRLRKSQPVSPSAAPTSSPLVSRDSQTKATEPDTTPSTTSSAKPPS